MTTQERIQATKKMILTGANEVYKGSGSWWAMYSEELVLAVSMETEGFGQQVAETVVKYKKASEKQAYFIARAFVENNLTVNFEIN